MPKSDACGTISMVLFWLGLGRKEKKKKKIVLFENNKLMSKCTRNLNITQCNYTFYFANHNLLVKTKEWNGA